MGRGAARDAESAYGDTAARSNKLGGFFGSLHILFAVLTIAAGVALIATGSWAIANQKDAGYGTLDWQGSYLAASVYLGIVAVVVGASLIFLAIIGMLAIGQGCCSLISAIIYVLAMIVLVVATAFAAAVLLTLAEGGIERGDTRTFFNDVWTETVAEFPLSACEVEREFQCRGFSNNQCEGCDSAAIVAGNCEASQLRACPDCTSLPSADDFTSKGCYDLIYPSLQRVVRPVGITAAIAAGISGLGLIFFMFARCCA
ncbi:hypothetical protein BU14_0574s0009 [Porphyra umbilicalis]|uniref:Tetraspanin n=1 Tax=Porphyra umbilicalis TaxID=2786 RepID=A0A1X6NRL9_PORUM|nr:hypothetical protein BU14_0574s0009 [Porphyra umbilicalis]|eukprot:OSX71238.1 hypothetical protein BU14_0574s0009 [Porphyra umbilicalis]